MTENSGSRSSICTSPSSIPTYKRSGTATAPTPATLALAATGLLAPAAGGFAATLAVRDAGPAVLLLRAVLEGALAGRLADWFAISALLRRRLALPASHTVILPADKDRIGEGTGAFPRSPLSSLETTAPSRDDLVVSLRVVTAHASGHPGLRA